MHLMKKEELSNEEFLKPFKSGGGTPEALHR
ncbi:Putative protein [Zobellia galactanivorans]|uniref:Uncharacterized protein n=1 Tax=Zobellia galactanivorans (strain DSM 12802 / CCUG 47099 / CIP 106680 / NCIMB 13871 / Dsij) TaxID=63186 RepID=G0L2N3_ZOBGA|nr:Putative protein [Zobellia galactanivorans]